MWTARALAIAAVVFSVGGYALGCPVMMISGTGERDNIVVTFRNSGKFPIRQLEFTCTSLQAASSRHDRPCREAHALFYPGMQYTVRYPYPGGARGTVTVALKSVTMSDGFVWKPSMKQPCRPLRIVPRRSQLAY
jgi:hypothetical protein